MAKTPSPLKLRRVAVGLTADEVTEVTGGQIYPKLLSRLENGHVPLESLRKVKFVALAKVLGLSEQDLLALGSAPADAGNALPVSPAPPAAPATQPPMDVHEKRRAELERSVDIGISKMRDELRRMDEHLRFLEAEVDRLRRR